MLAEVTAAVLLGALALWLVLWPMFSRTPAAPRPVEPPDPEETARGVALTALKEIEFDRETGKLSDADYAYLKEKYTAAALEALRAEAPDDIEAMVAARVRVLRSASAPASAGALACSACGPRPEPDAVFCSGCGQRLALAGRCERCGAALAPESRFCEGCGCRVAA
ncbi:MAG TPA: zinc ribbon domain-containing protein [Gemmatimonadales bacterium]|nr:zinc ribbon domain-containing protein [Gemmatimonadales bacterium]